MTFQLETAAPAAHAGTCGHCNTAMAEGAKVAANEYGVQVHAACLGLTPMEARTRARGGAATVHAVTAPAAQPSAGTSLRERVCAIYLNEPLAESAQATVQHQPSAALSFADLYCEMHNLDDKQDADTEARMKAAVDAYVGT
jgi:hypothetical protein